MADDLSDSSLQYRVIGDAMRALCEAGNAEASLEISQRLKGLAYTLPRLHALDGASDVPAEARGYLDALRSLRAAVDDVRAGARPDMYQRAQRVRAAGEAMLEAGEYLRDHDRILQCPSRRRRAAAAYHRRLSLRQPGRRRRFRPHHERSPGAHRRPRGQRRARHPDVSPHLTPQTVHELGVLDTTLRFAQASRPGLRAGELREIGAVLHQRLFCSLARQLAEWGVTQVIFVPDAFTRQLPLHLAWVCGKEINVRGVDVRNAEYFGELFPVEYAPCLQAIAVSQHQKRPPRVDRVVVLSDPTEDLLARAYRAMR